MGKLQAFPTASTSTAGLMRVGQGLRSVGGVVSCAAPKGRIWVTPLGSDTDGDGSITSPFATLARAFELMVLVPIPGGYTVYLPPGEWRETVAIPPPDTRIVGAGINATMLSNSTGASFTWQESFTDAGDLYFDDIYLNGDIRGRDGGEILLHFRWAGLKSCSLIGSIRLEQSRIPIDFDNCSNVRILGQDRDCVMSVYIGYDPSAGTNGSGCLYHEVVGGTWNAIEYSATETPALFVRDSFADVVSAHQKAVIYCENSQVGVASSTDLDCVVGLFNQAGHNSEPVCSGLGNFLHSELVMTRSVPPNYGEGDIVFVMPKQAMPGFSSAFVSSSLPGVGTSVTAVTLGTVTVHVVPPNPMHAGYTLKALVKP